MNHLNEVRDDIGSAEEVKAVGKEGAQAIKAGRMLNFGWMQRKRVHVRPHPHSPRAHKRCCIVHEQSQGVFDESDSAVLDDILELSLPNSTATDDYDTSEEQSRQHRTSEEQLTQHRKSEYLLDETDTDESISVVVELDVEDILELDQLEKRERQRDKEIRRTEEARHKAVQTQVVKYGKKREREKTDDDEDVVPTSVPASPLSRTSLRSVTSSPTHAHCGCFDIRLLMTSDTEDKEEIEREVVEERRKEETSGQRLGEERAERKE